MRLGQDIRVVDRRKAGVGGRKRCEPEEGGDTGGPGLCGSRGGGGFAWIGEAGEAVSDKGVKSQGIQNRVVGVSTII